MSRSREELKEIAKQILDYRRKDHSELLLSLTPEEQREITPLFKEVTEEQIAKEREEHEAFMKEHEEKNREHRRFLAETDRFIARYKAAERKAFALFVSKNKDKKLREYANGLLLSSGGNITPQQYEELLKKVALTNSEKVRKKTEAAYKRLKRKEATGELSEREEKRLEELEAELPIEFIEKVEDEIFYYFSQK